MIPYYKADTLLRIMDQRFERVKLAHTFYLEFLKMMNHYDLLEKPQIKTWKELYKANIKKMKGEIPEEEDQAG